MPAGATMKDRAGLETGQGAEKREGGGGGLWGGKNMRRGEESGMVWGGGEVPFGL